jgi:hypothetical protein
MTRPIPDPHSWRTVFGRLATIAALALGVAALMHAVMP